MSNALENYGRIRLQQMGWPEELTLRYDVSCCQGSGASFLVNIDAEDLITRYSHEIREELVGRKRVQALRATHREKARLELAAELGDFSINIREDHGCRYVHENSVDVELDERFRPDHIVSSLEEQIEEGTTTPWDKVSEEDWEAWAEEWRLRVKEWHEQDARKVHSELEDIALSGCHVNEDEIVWEFKTRNYMVKVLKKSVEDLNELDYIFDFEAIACLLSRDVEFCDLECSVWSLDEDGDEECELVSMPASCVTYNVKRERNSLMAVARDILSELINDARSLVSTKRGAPERSEAA